MTINLDVAHKPRLLAIVSGNSGVGKTWLSLTLAQAFGQRRSKVLVLDAGGRENEPILGPAGNDSSIQGEAMPSEASRPSSIGGFDLLAGQVSADALRAELENKSSYDIVILDLSAGLDDQARALAALADMVLLVITPDPASLTEAYGVLKQLKGERSRPEARIDARIIVNQAATIEAGKRAYSALSRATRRFLRLDPPLLGIIGHDEHVPPTIGQQKLQLGQFPQTKAGIEVQTIARRLLTRS